MSGVLPNTPGMTDASILAVINPSLADRNRSHLTENPTMPSLDTEFRRSTSIGAVITPSAAITVRANHFRINGANIPVGSITHYHVNLFRVRQSGAVMPADVSADEDIRKTTQAMKTLFARHPGWTAASVGAAPLGIAYDMRSALFTSRPLPGLSRNPSGEHCLEEIVGLLNQDGT